MENKNEIVKVIESAGLEKTKSEVILASFSNFFEQAKVWETKAKEIVVKDINDVAGMKNAREARLALKTIRVDAENKRKELKEQSLREGKSIDGIANIIKAVVVPIEEYLEKQEKFAEEQERQRKEKLLSDRVAALSKYVQDTTLYNLKEMSDASFDQLLKNAEKACEDKKVADKKAEEERLAKEKAQKEEDERIRKENAALKLKADEDKKKADAEKAEADKKLAEARAETERVQKELKAKEDADKKAIEDAKKAEADKAEKLAKASDSEKLLNLKAMFENIELPKVESQHAKNVLDRVVIKLQEINNILK